MDLVRDWDAELIENRTFKIGGELFEWIYPHWKIGAESMQKHYPVNPETQTDEEAKPFSWEADTQYAIDRVPVFLNPKNDAHKRWKALMARKEDAVPRYQIGQLYWWLVQTTNGLPTTPSSDASAGDGNGADASVSESSSPEVTSTA